MIKHFFSFDPDPTRLDEDQARLEKKKSILIVQVGMHKINYHYKLEVIDSGSVQR